MSTSQDQATATCANHPQVRACWVCSDCGAQWCGACVKPVKLEASRTVSICPSCDGLCEQGSTIGNQGDEGGVALGLLATLKYPLRGAPMVLVIIAVVLQAAMNAAGRLLPASTLLVTGLGVGLGAYVLTFLRQVLITSADGQSAPPDWPEFDTAAMVEAALQSAAVYLVSFGPWLLWRVWLHSETPETKLLSYGLFGVGAVGFPIAWLAVMIYDSLSALNPLLIVVSVWRTFPRYLGVCAVGGAVLGLSLGAEAALGVLGVPGLAQALSGGFQMYGVVVFVRAVGCFYHEAKDQLAWG